MNTRCEVKWEVDEAGHLGYSPDAFSRLDEADDRLFYSRDRFVEHLDSVALATVEWIIGDLIIEKEPVMLDLMAGWDSHIPNMLRPSQVIGLGLNENELRQNGAISCGVIHDLNRNPVLPFPDGTFDAVVNTVSVDYVTRPTQVFNEVGRILKPGGLFLVIFSNRMFPQKATKIWRESTEDERIILVEALFRHCKAFESPWVCISKGKPRPRDEKYAHLGIPSDPIYAVYADKRGAGPDKKPRPTPCMKKAAASSTGTLRNQVRSTRETLSCPHCSERLRKWAVPQTPFTEWDSEVMYICFNDACPYLVRGWDVMMGQGNPGFSYRLMYNPSNDRCMLIPVLNLRALRDGIVD